MVPGSVKVFADAEAVSEAAAHEFVRAAGEAVAARGRFRAALSGGSTPRRLYQLLAAPPYRDQIDWARTDLFWGDERAVPPDDPQSNYRMARETLLDPARVPPANVVRWRSEDPDLDAAARDYEASLTRGASAPWLDLALLGLGPDGHTASLFPGTSALAEDERLAVALDVAEMGTRRLTLTDPALCGARDVCFRATGPDKAPALATVVEARRLPAARIVRRAGPVTIFCDEAAARALAAPAADGRE